MAPGLEGDLEQNMLWHKQQGNCNKEARQCQDIEVEPGNAQKLTLHAQ